MPFRQLKGFTRTFHMLIPELPSIEYSWISICILELKTVHVLRGYEGHVPIAVDQRCLRGYT
jgi:hypothetical protein